jgi:ferredoxin/flavodoxin---NADP+ reductase
MVAIGEPKRAPSDQPPDPPDSRRNFGILAPVTDSIQIGTSENPLRVAIIGAGPAGFHAAIALLDQKAAVVEVDLFDRLPTPYGLVRAGVAPDHQKIKSVTRLYEPLGDDPRFAFFGNVELGRDIGVEDLLACYDQLLYATGSENDRRLGVPGEHLSGCAPASVFVGWYNGHPDYHAAKFDLSCRRVAIVGHGNVALDVARILVTSPAELSSTDVADHALAVFRQSQVKEIVLVGRRGPLQATFTPAELAALLRLPNVRAKVSPAELVLDAQSLASLNAMPTKSAERRNYELLTTIAQAPTGAAAHSIEFRFLQSPVEFIGDERGQLRQVRLRKNELVELAPGALDARPIDDYEVLDVGAVFVSIGFESKRIPGLPHDEKLGVIANVNGRLIDPATSRTLPNQYCAGWAQTGPHGLIASQKVGSAAVVACMMEDFAQGAVRQTGRHGRIEMARRLEARGIRSVSFADWKVIDATEVERGKNRGAPRVKFVDKPPMIELVEMQRRGW